ncbi:DUF1059 domain-containing protein [Acidiferrimicrobium sp. IK]|uniref:DUF1059 domain-containing protein n=1 Tax=Acidiferrimicrobium sp. IK TaxID=2871700 RepID=UPI0021CB0A8F|nr:DUF1059 domain-containing protein [Acidiferrimicrobium sp. IK]MCU4182750.1 DUF1059 domain-containing protein [Acidiferrimicrobium sp. IK]
MKTFACGDVVPGCTASWSCETEEEILLGVAEHAAVAHGMRTIPAGVVAEVRQHIFAG